MSLWAVSPRTETEQVLSAIGSLWSFSIVVLVLVFQTNLASFGGPLEGPRGWGRALDHRKIEPCETLPSYTHHGLCLSPIGMKRNVCPVAHHPRYSPLGTKTPSEQKVTLQSHFLKNLSPVSKVVLQLLTSVCLLAMTYFLLALPPRG